MVDQLKRILKYQLLLTVFSTPLLPASFGLGFEQIKVAFFLISTVLCTINFLYLLSQNQLKFSLSRIKISSGLFLLALLITSLTGVDPWNSIIGIHPYFQGFILYFFLFLFSLMAATVKIELKSWALATAFSMSLVSLRAIDEFLRIQILGQNIPTYAGRVISSFGQPNFYSGFLLLSLPILYLIIKDKKFQVLALSAVALSILAILISSSRAAASLLLILISFYLLTLLKKSKSFIALSLLSVLLVLTAFSFAPALIQKELTQPQSRQWLIDNSPEKRYLLWPIITEFISKRPFLGYGLENLSTIFPTYQRFDEQRNPAYYGIKNLVVDRSHNYILDLLFSSGILGLVAWGILILFVLTKAARNKVLLSALIIYLIWIQLQNQSVVQLIYFWLLVGLVDQKSI